MSFSSVYRVLSATLRALGGASLALCLVACGPEPTTPPSEDAFGRALDPLFEPWNRDDAPGVAVVILQDGKPLYRRGFGLASLEAETPITPDGTAFELNSVSKQMTAYAVHLLAHRGLLDLDADVRVHLPDLPDFGHEITARQLMFHTSGLREYLDLAPLHGLSSGRSPDELTQASVMSWLQDQQELNFEPGTENQYNNTGYSVLAQLVATVSGRSFRDFMRQEIFVPLGMLDTRVRSFGADGEQLATESYGQRQGPARILGRWQRVGAPWQTWGGGGVASTMDDLARWTEHLRLADANPEVVSALLERGTLNDGRPFDYASGIRWMERWGVSMFGHGGSGMAFRSWAIFVPDHDLTIVFSGNGYPGIVGLQPKLVEAVFEQLGIGEAPVPAPASDDLQSWVGHYADEILRGRLFLEDGELVYHSTANHVAVTPRVDDTFYIRDTRIHGERGPDGNVEALRFFVGAQEVRMARYQPKGVSPGEIQAYVGSYYSPELDLTVSVEESSEGLELNLPAGSFSFEPAHSGRFFVVEGRSAGLKFIYDKSAAVKGLRLNIGRSHNIRMERVDGD